MMDEEKKEKLPEPAEEGTGQGENEPPKKKKHVAYLIVFSIVMALVGVFHFFLSDMFGLQYYALILSWVIYVSFVVFGYVFLIKVRTWIKAVSMVGAIVIIGSFILTGGPTVEAKKAYAWNNLVHTE